MGLRKNPSIMESLMVKPAPLTLPRPPGNNGTLILTFTPYSKPSSKITNPRSLCARNSYRTTCPPKTTSQGYNGWKWLMVSWLEVPKSEILLSHVEQCRWNWLLTPKNNQIMEKYDLPRSHWLRCNWRPLLISRQSPFTSYRPYLLQYCTTFDTSFILFDPIKIS